MFRIKIKNLLVTILIVFCLSSFYFCYNYYNEFRKFAERNTVQQITYEASFVYNHLKTLVNDAIEKGLFIVSISNNINVIERSNIQEDPTKLSKHERVELFNAQSMLDSLKSKNQYITDVFFLNKNFHVVTSSNDANEEILADQSFVDSIKTGLIKNVKKYVQIDQFGYFDVIKCKELSPNLPHSSTKCLIYAFPFIDERDKSILGTVVFSMSFDDLVKIITIPDSHSVITIDDHQRANSSYLISEERQLNIVFDDSDIKEQLYVSVSKSFEKFEIMILDSMLQQVKANILISSLIGVVIIIAFLSIMMSFNNLFNFIAKIDRNHRVFEPKFTVWECSRTAELLVRLKNTIFAQVRDIQDKNKHLEMMNEEKEEANKKLAELNATLEKQVKDRTQSLRIALDLSTRCNLINSVIINQRSLINDNTSYEDVFNLFVAAIRQFNIERPFKFQYKVENDVLHSYSEIDKFAKIPSFENRKIENYNYDAGYYFFPLTMKEGEGFLIIESIVNALENDILGNISIFCREVSSYLDNRVLRDRLSYWARTDALTKLGNRVSFDQAWAFYETSLDSEIGLFLIDVNGLKEMNDNQGHEAGDALLKIVSERLKEIYKDYNASIYRIGGDEFTVILKDKDIDKYNEIAKKLDEVQGKPAKFINNQEINPTFSYGFADSRKIPFQMLYKQADVTMYAQKEAYYERRRTLFGENRKPRH